MSDEDLQRMSTANQTWRQALKPGDNIDVRIDGDMKCQKIKGWVQGQVDSIKGERVHIIFPELPEEYDHSQPIWTLDIAEFESKTKDDYQWRQDCFGTVGKSDYILDMHDNIRWEQGTIWDVYEDTTPTGRKVLMANIGFRVYCEGGKKKDEHGPYDGWSIKYDEALPIFNPRLQPHFQHWGKTGADDFAQDEDDGAIDDQIKPEEGHDRVYCVPRVNICLSSRFISYMNRFGNNGGFNALLDTLTNGVIDEHLTLTLMGYMITMISMPSKLFHKDWMAEYATKFTEAMKNQLINAPDNILKNVTAGNVNQTQVSIKQINSRVMDKA